MNKKLLTAVVGAALIAGPVVASAAGPTLYGNLHLSLDRVENSGSVSDNATLGGAKQGFVSSNNSDFGIRGDDDLGGGFKSVYQVQAGAYLADTGTNGFSGTLQDTFVGLSGNVGTLRIGRMDTPYKLLRPIVDGYGTRMGDARNVIGLNGLMSFDARISNSVRYDSPSLGGVVITAHYGSGENVATSSTNTDVVSFGAVWTGGPAKVGVARETHHIDQANNSALKKHETGTRVAGNMTFGPVTVGLFYEMLDDLAGVSGADKDGLGVTAAYKFGNSSVRAQLFDVDKVKTAATANGGTLMSLGFDHALSKQTTAYLIYAKVKNDDAATFKVSGAGAHSDSLTAVAGKSQTGLSAGLQVKF